MVTVSTTCFNNNSSFCRGVYLRVPYDSHYELALFPRTALTTDRCHKGVFVAARTQFLNIKRASVSDGLHSTV
jgi:hypothetical protein